MDDIFRANIIPALIGVTGSLVVVIIGWISATNQFNKSIKEQRINMEKTIQHEISVNSKNLVVQYITDKRVDWMYVVRDILSNYISSLIFIAESYKLKGDKVPSDLYREINCFTTKLKLLFNFDGELDNKIIKLIDGLNRSISNDEFDSEVFWRRVQEITKYSQVYLKLEWERVNLEAESLLDKAAIKETLIQKEKDLLKSYELRYENI